MRMLLTVLYLFLSLQGLENNNGQNSNATPPANAIGNGKAAHADDQNALAQHNPQSLENRRPPEGKDNSDSGSTAPIVGNEVVECKNEELYSTDVNNKVTVVHVVVTINGNGTLADLKKQRMQIRNNSAADVTSLNSPSQPGGDGDSIATTTTPASNDFLKFTGDTEDVVGYHRSPFGCCTIQ